MLYIFFDEEYELTKKLMSQIENKNICCIAANDIFHYRSLFHNLLCKCLAFFNIRTRFIFTQNFLNILKKITNKDKVLIWDSISYPLLFPFVKYCVAEKSIWIWNIFPKGSMKVNSIMKLKKWYNIYTFDRDNAKKYDLFYKNQVSYDISFPKLNKCDFFVYFVGLDKGRYTDIKNISNKLKELKLNYFIRIIQDNTTNYIDKELYGNKISFEKNVEYISKSKCILEIVQENQVGITLRAIEALLSKRKLITNNKEMIYEDIYNSNNVFVLGIDNENELSSFLRTDFVENSLDIEKYIINNWIKDFV